jgi:hypothetical protein
VATLSRTQVQMKVRSVALALSLQAMAGACCGRANVGQ